MRHRMRVDFRQPTFIPGAIAVTSSSWLPADRHGTLPFEQRWVAAGALCELHDGQLRPAFVLCPPGAGACVSCTVMRVTFLPRPTGCTVVGRGFVWWRGVHISAISMISAARCWCAFHWWVVPEGTCSLRPVLAGVRLLRVICCPGDGNGHAAGMLAAHPTRSAGCDQRLVGGPCGGRPATTCVVTSHSTPRSTCRARILPGPRKSNLRHKKR